MICNAMDLFFFNLKKYVKMLGSKKINGNWPKHFLNT